MPCWLVPGGTARARGPQPTGGNWWATFVTAAFIHYSGVRGNGKIDRGVAESSRVPADIAEELFRQGWRKAGVFRDGKLVGGVRIIDGQRDWWCEE